MSGFVVDTNVIFRVLKGDFALGVALENVGAAIDSTVYIECLQGSKSNLEKRRIRGFLDAFPLLLNTVSSSQLAISLIDNYSNSFGLRLADAQIASACLESSRSLLTFDISDFSFIEGLSCYEPDVEMLKTFFGVESPLRDQTDVSDKPKFSIHTDRERLQIGAIQEFLINESYWARNRSRQQTERAIENSLCFGLYCGERQIGFARVVSDCATFAYIGDVYVIREFQGQGLSKWLMETIIAHPDLQGLRRWVLATRDAHGLYEKFEFSSLRYPERWMERTAPNAY